MRLFIPMIAVATILPLTGCQLATCAKDDEQGDEIIDASAPENTNTLAPEINDYTEAPPPNIPSPDIINSLQKATGEKDEGLDEERFIEFRNKIYQRYR